MTRKFAFCRMMRFALLLFAPCSASALFYHATILDCAGHPVVGTVTLQEVYGVDGSARSRNACVRSLDSAGKFSCDKLAAGRYEFVVSVSAADASSPDALPTPLMLRESLENGPIRIDEDGQNQKHTLHVCTAAATPIAASIPDKPPASFLNLAFRTQEGDLPTGVSPVYDSESGKVLMPAPLNGNGFIQDDSSRALNLADKLTNPVF